MGRLYADLGLGYDAPNTVDDDSGDFVGDQEEGGRTFGLAVPRQPAKMRQQKASHATGALAKMLSCTGAAQPVKLTSHK